MSHWNGDVDFNNLKQNGVQFAMLKLGGEEKGHRKYQIDSKFFTYYHMAKAHGIYVGAYMFAGKDCFLWDGAENANYFIDYIEKYHIDLDYPFALDMETQPINQKEANTEYAANWCDAVEKRGYFAMIYGSDVWTFDDIVYADRLERYAFWVARYSLHDRVRHDHAIWQFTSAIKSKYPKLAKNMDGNYAMYDIAKVIKKKGLNRK